jgi:hypothetical protein
VNRMASQTFRWFRAVCACLLATAAHSTCACFASAQDKQDKKVAQTSGVDNTKMDAYRVLTQISFQALHRGDTASAAELARILERTWDQGQWNNSSDGSFCKTNRSVCQPIDEAMDAAIEPILRYATKAPERVAVRAAYNDFLEKLKEADAIGAVTSGYKKTRTEKGKAKKQNVDSHPRRMLLACDVGYFTNASENRIEGCDTRQ